MDKTMDTKKWKVRRFFRLLALSARMDLAWFLRDTKFALFTVISDTIGCIGDVGSIFLLAVRFGGIGGMDRYEVLFMLGYVVLISGLFILLGSANNIHISRIIGRGQLEHLFLQPLPLSIQLLTSGFVPFTCSLKPLAGILVMGYSLGQLGMTVTWWWVLSLLANLLVTFSILVGLSYLFSSAAFYAPVAAEEISTTVLELNSSLSQYPLSGMPGYIQIPLITLFPSGLMAWFPTMALLGKPPLNLPAFFPVLVALALLAVTNAVFRAGWRHYMQRGSNRYLPYGFR